MTTVTNHLALQIALIGPWRPFDPFDPLPGPEYASVLAQLLAAGLRLPTQVSNANLVLSAVMIEAPLDDFPDEPPLIATIMITEHASTTPLQLDLTDDGQVIPARRVKRRSFDWPTDDVGAIDLHEVSYLIAAPGATVYYTLSFATPNIPIADEMEILFDSIVSTIGWVEPE